MLSLLPTPIGNLEDISYRAVRLLTTAQIIFAEDTRVTKSLISLLSSRLDITFPYFEYISLHSHNEQEKLSTIDKTTFEKNCIFVSDAGMPGISDPGMFLVRYAQENHIPYEVLPGANAALTALVMSGMCDRNFTFYGFLPHQSKTRITEIKALLNQDQTVILYESPHRILQFVDELVTIDAKTPLYLIKELTKKHETAFKGSALEVQEALKSANTKGEWVVILSPLKSTSLPANLLEIVAPLPFPPKEAAKLLAKLSGQKTKICYEALSSYQK
jgi:16S rRNA (cytidine1402-2'-O)-methyltransferase